MVEVERVCPNVTRETLRVVLNGLKRTKNLLRRVWSGGNMEERPEKAMWLWLRTLDL